jgi:hypothetical protein
VAENRMDEFRRKESRFHGMYKSELNEDPRFWRSFGTNFYL